MKEENDTNGLVSVPWYSKPLNILNSFAMLFIYMQIRILKTPLFWKPIMSFKSWCWVDDSAFVRKDFKTLMQVYSMAGSVLIFIYTNWVYCLLFMVLVLIINLVFRHFKLRKFIKERTQVMELTGLQDYQVAKILRDTRHDLNDISDFYNKFNRNITDMDIAIAEKGLDFRDYSIKDWNDMLIPVV